MTMNPIKNNILLTYLGNYGPSYTSNDNIPNPWAMILNPYYLGNPPLTFFNTPGLVAYPFSNMVFIKNYSNWRKLGCPNVCDDFLDNCSCWWVFYWKSDALFPTAHMKPPFRIR
jgi:hypothetical protein